MPFKRGVGLLALLCLLVSGCALYGGEELPRPVAQPDDSVTDDDSARGGSEASDDDAGALSSEQDTADSETERDAETTSRGADELSGGIDCAAEEAFCVGVVADTVTGTLLADGQAAKTGVEESVADATVYLEVDSVAVGVQAIDELVASGFDLIVTVGPLGEAAMLQTAQQSPAVRFLGIGQSPAVLELANVTRLTFAEDQVGFLAGSFAGLITETDRVVVVGATNADPTTAARADGFVAGAAFTNVRVEVVQRHHPDSDLQVSARDRTWGAEAARSEIEAGADVIFSTGGPVGDAALIEAAVKDGDVLCVGVVTDQWVGLPAARPCLATSIATGLENNVADLIALARIGALQPGDVQGSLDLAAYHSFETRVPVDIQEQMAELAPLLINGTIVTGVG